MPWPAQGLVYSGLQLTWSVHLQDTKPIFIRESYKGADKLKDKVAIITGGPAEASLSGIATHTLSKARWHADAAQWMCCM
jgi:hypothetical protein